MRIATLAGLTVLFGSIAVAAQKGDPASTKSSAEYQVSRSSFCPLGMDVRQGVGGRMMAAGKDGTPVETFAARLKLLLTDNRPDRTAQRMVKARVSVRGWNGKAQVLPAGSSPDQNPDLAKVTLTVPLTGGGLPEASADLVLPGFTAARSVELESITFDDGDVWSFSGACRAVPDLLMRVSTK